MGTVKYSVEEAKKLKGGSDLERLKNMTEEEIEKAAQEDENNPLLTNEELKEFKSTVHKADGVYGHDKNKNYGQAASKKSQG